MHLVGFIIRIYHDARSPEHQINKINIINIIFPTFFGWTEALSGRNNYKSKHTVACFLFYLVLHNDGSNKPKLAAESNI